MQNLTQPPKSCKAKSMPPSSRPDRCAPDEQYPIEIDNLYFCWRWVNGLDRDGYGRHRGKLAHKYVYEKEVGPVPEGMMLDHRCRVRCCTNPNHLEPVTQSVNERRKSWRHRAKMTTCCKRGHDKLLNGIRTKEGGIVCRLCE